jgi:hypothetical protein
MGELAWSIWAILIVPSALGGWVVSAAIQRRWGQEQDDQVMIVDQPGSTA